MVTTQSILVMATALAAGWLVEPVSQYAGSRDALASDVESARAAPVRVVATLPVYASIVQAIGGAEVTVTSIADPREDAHFVRPKPSFALEVRRADLFITTGLDLELWVPAVLDRAGNAAVRQGGAGYVTAYTGITLLDVPASTDRSGGDIHIYGNPHVFTDPLNALIVASNIVTGLKRVAADRAAVWDAGLARFTAEIQRRTFGAELVEIVGADVLVDLARSGQLMSFLQSTPFEDQPLMTRLGGWLAAGQSFRGQRIICYHKNWAYFEDRFGVECAEYVESKPGIPPTPGHVATLIQMMRTESIRVVIGAEYYGRNKIETVASRADARPVVMPLAPGTVPGADDYYGLIDVWVQRLADAFSG